jgi:hypothetical protein
VHVEIDFEHSGTWIGRLTGPDGSVISFSGRLGLLAVLEQLAGAPSGPLTPGALDGARPQPSNRAS